MEKRKEKTLDGYNKILFGKLNRSYVTKGEYHKTRKPKCHEEEEDD